MADILTARTPTVQVTYNNRDITINLDPFLTQVEYSCGIEKADDVQLTLRDDGRWRDKYIPKEGGTLNVDMFFGEETKRPDNVLHCGKFTLDETEYSGFPSTATFKGLSFPYSAVAVELKSRGWENVTLRSVGESIASNGKLEYHYISDVNPHFGRVDQRFSTDLKWLTEKAHAAGLRINCSHGKLIIFSGEIFDQKSPVKTIGPVDVMSYRFTFATKRAYSHCVLKWHNSSSKKLHIGQASDPTVTTGQTLRINERCESDADAQRTARHRLEAANRMNDTAELTLPGDLVLVSPNNIKLKGWGDKVDGKWAIEDAKHSLWPYTTALTLRKIK